MRCQAWEGNEYRQRLINEMGQEHVDWLECDDNHKSLKEQYPDISDVKNETARYRKMIKIALT